MAWPLQQPDATGRIAERAIHVRSTPDHLRRHAERGGRRRAPSAPDVRIAYFAHISGGAASGVFHKVAAQTGRWSSLGHDVKLFLLTRDDPMTWQARHPGAEVRSFGSHRERFAGMFELLLPLLPFLPDHGTAPGPPSRR
jgi:hypothetical protein